MRHKDLPQRWRNKIAEYLNTQGKGKYVTFSDNDFHSDKKVHIKFIDDSFAEFHNALIINAPEWNEVGLFTEHCGYHLFNIHGVDITWI